MLLLPVDVQYTVIDAVPVLVDKLVVPDKQLEESDSVTVTATAYNALSSDFSVAVIVKSKFIDGVVVVDDKVIEVT